MSEPWVPSTQKGFFANGLAWVLGILLVVGLVGAITFGVRWAMAPAKGKLQAREQINSGSFRITAYNHFFDLCASVQTTEQQIDAQKQVLAVSTTADDKSRIETNIAGLEGARADGINQYNADAAKSYTEGQFRSSKLPYQLDSTAYTGGNRTSCVS